MKSIVLLCTLAVFCSGMESPKIVDIPIKDVMESLDTLLEKWENSKPTVDRKTVGLNLPNVHPLKVTLSRRPKEPNMNIPGPYEYLADMSANMVLTYQGQRAEVTDLVYRPYSYTPLMFRKKTNGRLARFFGIKTIGFVVEEN